MKSENDSKRKLYEEYHTIFTNYCNQFESLIITSSNKGIDTNIRLSEEKGENTTRTYIVKSITKIGIYIGMATTVAIVAMTLLNFSIGGAVAYALDKFDKSGLNGRSQF